MGLYRKRAAKILTKVCRLLLYRSGKTRDRKKTIFTKKQATWLLQHECVPSDLGADMQYMEFCQSALETRRGITRIPTDLDVLFEER